MLSGPLDPLDRALHNVLGWFTPLQTSRFPLLCHCSSIDIHLCTYCMPQFRHWSRYLRGIYTVVGWCCPLSCLLGINACCLWQLRSDMKVPNQPAGVKHVIPHGCCWTTWSREPRCHIYVKTNIMLAGLCSLWCQSSTFRYLILVHSNLYVTYRCT